ncbi:hypothetical protein KJ966_03660, partial [bacterium]|nr:hypothetical protein [bacterium]
MKWVIGIIIAFSIYLNADRAVVWSKMQDKNLLFLKNIHIEDAKDVVLTARKAHAAFYLGTQMLKMPDDIESKDFIAWCKENGVRLIWWSAAEAQTRPKLRGGEWLKECE